MLVDTWLLKAALVLDKLRMFCCTRP